MVGELESIGHLLLARRAGGEPVELVRSPEELVFLAFDSQIKRLVELHVLRSGKTLDSVAKKSAFERAQQASTIRGPSFMRILEVGEDQGLVYYTSNLNDGEFVADYTMRRGQLPPATVFSLVFQLLDDLIQLKDYQRLVAHMRLDRVVVSTLEDTFLQLRIYDYGLSSIEPAPAEDNGASGLVIQACELLFLMLTGKAFSGDNPDRCPPITALPMNLRTTMRAALTDPATAPATINKVRDDVREAFGSLVSSIQARNSRKHLVVTPTLQPRSQLQDLLLENVPVEIILGNRFRAEDPDQVRRYPFSIPCINAKNEQNVTVHLLPPSRIVDKAQYEAVPLQMWRFNAERHPNILRSLSLWESPDWTFLTEEREPGFALSRLLAERICLNPNEVIVLLRQVRAGLEQALECGVQRVDLHPSNIVLRVGKAGPLLLREYERLMQKRIDAWPAFVVKLRAHLTMRNLYEPLLVDKPEQGEHDESHLADRDYRHRAFVALAAYLLTGERQTGGAPRFPEAVPETLATFVRESMELAKQVGRTPNPAEFLEQFEAVMNGPAVPDLATRLRGVTVAIEEMESVGSVSDFDEEWPAPTQGFNDANEPKGPVARSLNVSHFSTPRKQGAGWPTWAAAAVVMSGLLSWWLIPKATSSREPALAVVTMPMAADPPQPPKPKLIAGAAAKTPAPVAVAAAKVSPPPAPAVQKKPETKPVILAARPASGPGPATMALKPELAGTDLAKKTGLPPTPPVFANVPGLVKVQAASAPESLNADTLASSLLANSEPSQATSITTTPPAPVIVAATIAPAPPKPALAVEPTSTTTTPPALVIVATTTAPAPKPALAVEPVAPPAAKPAPVIVAATAPALPKPALAVEPVAPPAAKPAPPTAVLAAASPPQATPAMVAKSQHLPAAAAPVMITATLPALAISFAPRPLPTLANEKAPPPTLPTLAAAPNFPAAKLVVIPVPTPKPQPPVVAAAPTATPAPAAIAVAKPVILAATKPNAAVESKAKSPSAVMPAAAPAPADTVPAVAAKPAPSAAKAIVVTSVTTPKIAAPTNASVLKPANPAPSVPRAESAPNEVIIRKAILPTPEEIAKFKAAQAKERDNQAARLDTAQAR